MQVPFIGKYAARGRGVARLHCHQMTGERIVTVLPHTKMMRTDQSMFSMFRSLRNHHMRRRSKAGMCRQSHQPSLEHAQEGKGFHLNREDKQRNCPPSLATSWRCLMTRIEDCKGDEADSWIESMQDELGGSMHV